MKKFLLAFSILGAFTAQSAFAQTFTTHADTVTTQLYPGVDTVTNIVNDITVTGTASDSVKILWKVTASDFPQDWLASDVLGICDNISCRINLNGNLWDGQAGQLQESEYYKGGTEGDFHMQLDPNNMHDDGTHYMTVNMVDSFVTTSSKNITFVVTRGWKTGIAVTTKTEGVSIYPNPASNNINVVVNGSANVKNFTVYDMTGKMINVAGRMNGQVAIINLENVPAGIYFIRLFNAQGNEVAASKFTRM